MLAPQFDLLVIGLQQHLRAAQRVADRLLEQPREELAEEPVPEIVDELHSALFHRIDEARAVDEASFPRGDRSEEPRQVLGRHCEVGVKDHQHVSGCRVKSLPHGVPLAKLEHHGRRVRVVLVVRVLRLGHLQDELDVLHPAIPLDDLFDLLLRAVGRRAVDEDDFGVSAEVWHPLDRRLDVAELVTARDDHRAPQPRGRRPVGHGLGHHDVEHVEVLERAPARQQPVDRRGDDRDRHRHQERVLLLEYAHVGQAEQATRGLSAHPVLAEGRHRKA